MIESAGRDAYFNDTNEELWWFGLPHNLTYEDIKFHNWVYRINDKVYTFGSKEFKEEFNKALAWAKLKT